MPKIRSIFIYRIKSIQTNLENLKIENSLENYVFLCVNINCHCLIMYMLQFKVVKNRVFSTLYSKIFTNFWKLCVLMCSQKNIAHIADIREKNLCLLK